jgi:hypothetical protein
MTRSAHGSSSGALRRLCPAPPPLRASWRGGIGGGWFRLDGWLRLAEAEEPSLPRHTPLWATRAAIVAEEMAFSQ